MKFSFWVIIAMVVLSSCQPAKKEEKQKVITVSILPQKTFVKKIAGDDFKVNVLIPDGGSPATYSLLPAQMKDILGSEAWFRIGYIGFEHAWMDKIMEANKKMKVYNLAEDLDLIASTMEKHGDHVHMDGIDPHVWLSPINVKKMAATIKSILTELNPEAKEKYAINYLKFIKEIDLLNIEIKNTLSDLTNKTIIVYHPSLAYFARDYGLIQESLEHEGKEPTPQHLKRMVDLAKDKNIKSIYIQTEFDREHARLFANEIGGEIIQIAPLDEYWQEGMLYIAEAIRDSN